MMNGYHFLAKYFPPVLTAVQAVRRRLRGRRERRIAERIAVFRQSFADRCEWTVQTGPLRGTKYRRSSRSDTLLPRLIGAYEAEIFESIEKALGRQPAVILDVGCEEGVVAAGLARRLAPGAKLYAFDISPDAREWCREMVQLNGVEERVVIEAACTHERMQALLGDQGFVFCDCEGYEYELLDPAKAPALKNADILVELHDHERTDVDIKPALLARFADSH